MFLIVVDLQKIDIPGGCFKVIEIENFNKLVLIHVTITIFVIEVVVTKVMCKVGNVGSFCLIASLLLDTVFGVFFI